jgi:phosphoglycerol transferase MdoB-like AlkP superfamily enzyme
LRVQAPKVNGSCDADFALLFGALPSNRMAPYRIPAFPFNRSLVNVLHDRGLHTSIYHGVNGTFFERRGAFDEMGFDRMTFREEVIERLGLVDPEWTIEDGRLFDLATQERTYKDRFFEFTITGTSHTPFQFALEDHVRRFFPESDDRNYAYFDTVQYVDKALGDYVDALPDHTVVIIYGDHFSRVENPELSYASELVGEFGIVPALLFQKTKAGIVPLFEIDPAVASSKHLRLVDITAWLRASLGIEPATKPYTRPFSGG